MKDQKLSEHQLKLLNHLAAHKDHEVQLAGYGQAKWLSVARALKRRGLANSFHTGKYYITEAGETFLKEATI
jgi:hypothetical protein